MKIIERILTSDRSRGGVNVSSYNETTYSFGDVIRSVFHFEGAPRQGIGKSDLASGEGE